MKIKGTFDHTREVLLGPRPLMVKDCSLPASKICFAFARFRNLMDAYFIVNQMIIAVTFNCVKFLCSLIGVIFDNKQQSVKVMLDSDEQYLLRITEDIRS